MAKRTKDEFTRDWIIENSVEILSRYEPGVLTIRALHYQLVRLYDELLERESDERNNSKRN